MTRIELQKQNEEISTLAEASKRFADTTVSGPVFSSNNRVEIKKPSLEMLKVLEISILCSLCVCL